MWKKILGIFRKKRKTTAPKNGKWKQFNKHAVLIAEGYYENDIKHGPWKQFYETGELLLEEHYERGMLHGRYATYHPNGRLFSEGTYQHGKRQGRFNVYDHEGNLVRRMVFINNQLAEDVDVQSLKVGVKATVA